MVMDVLGSLKSLSCGLDRMHWSQAQLRVVANTIIGLVQSFPTSKAHKRLIVEICGKVSKQMTEENRCRLVDLFVVESGDVLLLLRLYSLLNVPCCLEILAGLTEAYARKRDFDHRKVPKFQVVCKPEELLEVEHRAGAVFIAQPAPTSDLLQDYISQFLSEKPRNSHIHQLYKGLLSRVGMDLYRSKLFPVLQRLIRRSAAMLSAVSSTVEALNLDLSDSAKELLFPSLSEHLFQPASCQFALTTLHQIAKKCSNHADLIQAVLSLRDQSESETVAVVKALNRLNPQREYSDLVVDYCLDRGHRVRTEENKQVVIQCIGRFATSITAKLTTFFEREGLKAATANVYFKLGGKGIITGPIGSVSTMQTAILLSVGIPSPCPAPIKAFLTDPNSPFSVLNPSNSAENQAMARLCLAALDLFPDSVSLYRKLAKALLQDNQTRAYILSNWSSTLSLSQICPFLAESIESEDCYKAFQHNSRALCKFFMEKRKSVEDECALLRLITCPGVMNRDDNKRILRLFTQRYGEIILKIPFECTCEQPYLSAILCIHGGFEPFFQLAAQITSSSLFQELHSVQLAFEQAIQDPEFIGILTLDSQVKALAQAHGLVLSAATEPARVQQLLTAVYSKAVRAARYVLEVYRLCQVVGRWIRGERTLLRAEMLRKGLFQAVKLSKIEELREEAIAAVIIILREIPLFSPISHDIAKVLLAIEQRKWKEKAARRITNYINERVSLALISPSEAFILSHIATAACLQPNTNLRSTATDILARLVYERKVENTGEIMQVAVYLLQRYSGQVCTGLLMSLRQGIKPEEWEILLRAAVSLPTTSKELLLSHLLQYEEGLPRRKWTEGPLWLLLHDESEDVVDRALDVWHKFRLVLSPETILEDLCTYLCDESEEIQAAAARGLAAVWSLYPELTSQLLIQLFSDFHRKAQFSSGLPMLLRQLVPALGASTLELTDLILAGVGEVDLSHREELIALGIELMHVHGKQQLAELFSRLQRGVKGVREEEKWAAVLLLGHLAQHFQPADQRVDPTITLLLEALNAGNETLYRPISNCLSQLIAFRREKSAAGKATRAQDRKLVDDYLKVIFSSAAMEEKRGSAYSFAAIMKGLGIHCFDRFDVNSRFERVIRNGKVEERGGLLLAIEALTTVLRTAFEPYAIEYVPFVLDCFEENLLFSQAQFTLKAVFSGLSTTGARRLVMGGSRPALLAAGVDDSRWRSRAGTVEALGKLACCAPKRVAEFLSEAVAQVLKAFSSASPEVIQAACRALEDIGSVTTTPEVSQAVPLLIKALSDASTLKEALISLLETPFTHYLDVPALSLLVPVVEGGLKSRIPEVRKLGAQVVGGLMAVVSPSKLLYKYTDRLVTALKSALADPMPEVRNIAAQNLAQFCHFLSPKDSRNIIQSLEATFLTDNISQTERSGAVHAYSEVSLRSTHAHWEGQLDYILSQTRAERAEVRSAFLGVLMFLPDYTGSHLDEVLPAVLGNLSHSNDEVRGLAVRLLQTLIRANSRRNVDQLLTSLEAGLFNADPKARQISLTLIGELLDVVETADRREGRRERTIPQSERNRTLAAVYILRSDWNKSSRSQADKVWQTLVENTPRVLPALTPALVQRLTELSDSAAGEMLTIVYDAVEESIKKDEGSVFSEYISQLEKEISVYPKGVAIVLREACENARIELIEEQWERLSALVRTLLCSSNNAVVTTAGEVFTLIYERIPSAKDFLLRLLQSLDPLPKAFRQLLRKKSPAIQKVTLPFLFKLTARATILKEIADLIADDLLTLSEWKGLFPALIKEAKDYGEALEAVCLIVTFLSRSKAIEPCLEAVAAGLEPSIGLVKVLSALVHSNRVDYSSHITRLLELLMPCIHLEEAKEAVIPALEQTLKPMRKEEMHTVLRILTCEFARAEALPCLSLPHGLRPFLSILSGALLFGPSEAQESASRTYFDAIRLTSNPILCSYSPSIAGPLLRMSLERLSFPVHICLLSALQSLIKKSSESLFRYVPQLRSVLIQALRSADFPVRQAGLHFLPDFLVMETQPELLVTALCSLQGDSDATMSCLKAVYEIAKKTQIAPKVAIKAAQRLLEEVEIESNGTVLEEVGRLMLKLSPNSGDLVKGITIGEKGILSIGAYLAVGPMQNISAVTDLYQSALVSHFEGTVKSLIVVAKAHPKPACQLVLGLLPVLAQRLADSLDLLCCLPPEEFLRDSRPLSDFLAQLAKFAAETKQKGANPALASLFRHLFRLNEPRGIRSVLRSLHLLSTPWQEELREYAYSLLSRTYA